MKKPTPQPISVIHNYMTIDMPDGSRWGVPVEMIARNRAEYYAKEFGGDVEKSLAEDTLPLFEEDHNEIFNWAMGNMNWIDFNGQQVRLSAAPSPDFQKGWIHGAKGLIS